MKGGDYFAQQLRESTQLKSSAVEFIKDLRTQWALEIVNQDGAIDIARAQGAVRGLDRLISKIVGGERGVRDAERTNER